MFGKTIIYAHRGASGTAPENTIAAFEKAVEVGAHGIECDVQMTRDGKLVICHDEALDRTSNGKGLIKDMTYADIRALDAGGWFDAQFAGAKVPLLEELLELILKNGMYLNIELKNGIVLYEGMEDKVVDMVKGFGLQDKTIFSSFNHYSIYDMKKKYPELFTGALYMEGLYQPWNYLKEIGCDCAHPFYMAARPEMVEGYKQNGITVNVFTVDDPNAAAFLVKSGVEGIITNYPEKMLEI